VSRCSTQSLQPPRGVCTAHGVTHMVLLPGGLLLQLHPTMQKSDRAWRSSRQLRSTTATRLCTANQQTCPTALAASSRWGGGLRPLCCHQRVCCCAHARLASRSAVQAACLASRSAAMSCQRLPSNWARIFSLLMKPLSSAARSHSTHHSKRSATLCGKQQPACQTRSKRRSKHCATCGGVQDIHKSLAHAMPERHTSQRGPRCSCSRGSWPDVVANTIGQTQKGRGSLAGNKLTKALFSVSSVHVCVSAQAHVDVIPAKASLVSSIILAELHCSSR
jgi:hypothetical protein